MSFLFLWGLWACTTEPEPKPESKAKEVPSKEALVPSGPSLILDGESFQVDWDDGDTFSYVDPKTQKKVSARLNGFNTLESYGPVHQWGEWTAKELYDLAKEAGVFARAQIWTCTDTQKGGGYGRILVDCPDLRDAIIRAGLAHPFSVDQPAPEADLKALKFAIDTKAGIWAKGAPQKLITSLHSQAERDDKDAYNRVCDLTTGQCDVENHTDTYSTCQNVCLHDSCMLYVPYKERYGEQRASCLH